MPVLRCRSACQAARATPKASPTRVRRFAVRASDGMQSPGLLAHHDGKPDALAHQLLGRTVFDDLALLDGDDAMGVANGRQAMRDNQHRPALADLLHVRMDQTGSENVWTTVTN